MIKNIKKKMLLLFLSAIFSASSMADTFYINYTWAAPEDITFTNSWVIINIDYSIETSKGFIQLIDQISHHQKVDSVAIQFIKRLKDDQSEESGIIKHHEFGA